MASLAALRHACDRLVTELDGFACVLSRVIGDVLVIVAEDSTRRAGRLGRGYLLSDYPQTVQVVEERAAVALSLDDPAAHPTETAVLHELGFESLLMLPFELGGEVWGLVELYGEQGRRFGADDTARAAALLRELEGELAAP